MRIYSRIIINIVIIGLLLLSSIVCGAPIPDYQVKNLANGMKVVYKVQSYTKNVTVRIIVPAGLLSELQRQRGISHLLEHLIFRGNEKYTTDDLHKQIDDHGGYYNGFTFLNRTEFYLEVLPNDLMTTLPMYLDLIFNPGLAEQNIKLEKKIICVESELNNIPGNTFFLYLNELTQHHLDSMINSISQADLVNYHKQFYLPGKITTIITGAFNPDEVNKLLATFKNPSEISENPEWLFHDSVNNIVLDDYLNGEEYQILFGFDLKNLEGKELMIAKILPFILKYESRQYDHLNDRPLDYQIELFYLPGHYYLVFNYRDTRDKYTLDLNIWHQKNLERYCRYLQTKNFNSFLTWFTLYMNKTFESMSYDSVALNDFYCDTLFEPAAITSGDLDLIQLLNSNDIKKFVQKYLIDKYYQKIVVKAL